MTEFWTWMRCCAEMGEGTPCYQMDPGSPKGFWGELVRPRRKMLSLTGTQASDGKMGPLQGVVGLGADRVRGVDRWLAGDSHQENENDEHWHGSSANPSCLSRALPVRRHAHSVRRPHRSPALFNGVQSLGVRTPLHCPPSLIASIYIYKNSSTFWEVFCLVLFR